MKLRFSKLAAVLLLSVLILSNPCLVIGEDDIVDIPATADNQALLTTWAADNAAIISPEADNQFAADSANEESTNFPADNEVSLNIASDSEVSPEPAIDNEALTGPATDDATQYSDLSADDDFREPNFGEEPIPQITVADPLEPLNRMFFVFNDRLYFWVAKPVAQGYSYVVNEDIRLSVQRFFSNIGTPVRVVNNLLQGEIVATGTELLRFLMNSTMGLLGFFDVAKDFGIEKRDTDLGLTLGKYGIGNGIFLVLPVFGASTLRDGIGSVGDWFLDPVRYLDSWETVMAVRTYRTGNEISLRIGLYEQLTGAAVDPYVAVKDAYIQFRHKAVRGRPR